MHFSSFVAILAVSVSALPAPQPLDRRAGGLLGGLLGNLLGENLLDNLLGGNLLGSLLGGGGSGSDPLGGLLSDDGLLGGLLGGQDSGKETPDAPTSDLVCGTSSCLNKCTTTCQSGVEKCAKCLASCLQPAASNTKKGVQSTEEETSYLDVEGEQDLSVSDVTVDSSNKAVEASYGQTTHETTANPTASVSPDTQSDSSSEASQ